MRKNNPFIELSKSSVSWGDYDRDGDMDLAIMGQSNTVGAVAAIYENKDGTFERLQIKTLLMFTMVTYLG